MSLQYIRDSYKKPAHVGVRVSMGERHGVIDGSSGPHVSVRFDGQLFSLPVHPNDLVYHVGQSNPVGSVLEKKE